MSNVVNAVYVAVVDLEDPYDIIGPGGDTGDGAENYHSRDHAEFVENVWKGQDAEAHLSFYHQACGSEPADLEGELTLSARGHSRLTDDGCTNAAIIRAVVGDFSEHFVVLAILWDARGDIFFGLGRAE